MNNYGRIYQNMPTGKLLRLKTFFMTCRFQIVVKNLNNLYSISSRVLGKKFTNNFIKFIYGDIFLAGETTKELEKCLSQLKIDGLIGISDYAREFLTIEEEKTEIDSIIKIYKDSIDSSITVDNRNSIAMKVSSFGNVDSLKTLNSLQFALCTLEDNLDKSYEELSHEFTRHKITDFLFSKDLIEKIKQEIKGNKFDLNLYEMILTDNSKLLGLIKEGLKLKESELNNLKEFVHNLHSRLMQVFDHARLRDCLIMVDAEQSYLRFITDYIVAYYFKQFNKDKCILAQTLQCYLKTQQHDLVKWKKFCDEMNLKMGLKLVRGAYMNEEKRIANEKGLIYPVCNFIEETNENYNKSIEFLFKNYKLGDKYCIATHNLESISLTGELTKKYEIKDNIFCAQLLGIAEHATGYCKEKNIKVAKYVPFGNFDILIPYLVRRAEESSMIQKLKSQNDLLNEELKCRLAFWKKSQSLV